MTLLDRHPFGRGLAIEKHRLANGLRVLLLRDPSAPVLAYQTWFKVGSRHESDGKTGIAHLFEHLMFNQTEHLAAGEFDRRMEAAGGETNAATWVDWTHYTDSLPASRLELAAQLESDRMQHLTLTDAQVESEREVVANERRFRVDDDVEGFLGEELYRLAFTKHPYRWPTIGWMRDIMALSIDDCRAFYRTFYAPNNATLVLVGDLDPKRALAVIEKHYGDIPPMDVPDPAPPREPAQKGERRKTFAKPVQAERGILAYRAPAQPDADWLPLQLAHAILLGGPSARLYKRLVIDTELASSVLGMLTPFAHPGLYEVVVSMTRGHTVAEAQAILDEEIARLAAEAPPPAELAKVLTRLETDLWSELETADGKAEALGHYETTFGDFKKLFEVQDRLAEISGADIRRVVREHLVPERRTVVIAEPSGGAEDDGEDDGGERDVDAGWDA